MYWSQEMKLGDELTVSESSSSITVSLVSANTLSDTFIGIEMVRSRYPKCGKAFRIY